MGIVGNDRLHSNSKRPSCTVLLSVHETVKWTLQQAWY